MSVFLSALLMGIGLKINQFREGEGGIAPPAAPALAYDLQNTGTSQALLLFGGI